MKVLLQYPKMLYHQDGRQHIAKTPEEEQRILEQDGWSKKQTAAPKLEEGPRCLSCTELRRSLKALETRAGQRVKSLTDDIHRVTAENERIARDYDAKSQELANANVDIAALMQANASGKEHCAHLIAKITEAEEANAKLVARVAELEAKKKK